MVFSERRRVRGYSALLILTLSTLGGLKYFSTPFLLLKLKKKLLKLQIFRLIVIKVYLICYFPCTLPFLETNSFFPLQWILSMYQEYRKQLLSRSH